jgi:hypothetical protein
MVGSAGDAPNDFKKLNSEDFIVALAFDSETAFNDTTLRLLRRHSPDTLSLVRVRLATLRSHSPLLEHL